MDERQRLANCFMAVFPELSDDEIVDATPATVQSWDSVATVTLISVVEEEFGISLELEDPTKFDSFHHILSYLKQKE